MADYTNLSEDIKLTFSPEMRRLYYLALFGLTKHTSYVETRAIDHDAYKHLFDRFCELALFSMIGEYVDHPHAKRYSSPAIEVKPNFTQEMMDKIESDYDEFDTMGFTSKGSNFADEFSAFIAELEKNAPYTE